MLDYIELCSYLKSPEIDSDSQFNYDNQWKFKFLIWAHIYVNLDSNISYTLYFQILIILIQNNFKFYLFIFYFQSPNDVFLVYDVQYDMHFFLGYIVQL